MALQKDHLTQAEEETVINGLRACPIFTKCSDGTIKLILTKADIDRIQPGDAIFRTGDVSNWFYVLVHGTVESSLYGQALNSSSLPGYIGGLTSTVNVVDHQSDKHNLHVSGATSSEITSPNAVRSFTHQAKTHVTIVKIGVQLFKELARVDPDFEMGIMRHFSERLRTKNSRLATMMHEQKSGGKQNIIIISVFDTKPYDKSNLQLAFKNANFQGRTVKLHFIEAKLDISTVSLAAGSSAICMFVNDQANAEVLRALRVMGVELILLRCAGFNGVDIQAAAAHHISIARVPAYSPHAVAEHAAALLLSVTRRTYLAYNRIRNGNFSLAGLTGRDLNQKTCGVIGTGKIGRAFAMIALGLGMKVLLWDAFPNLSFAKQTGTTYVSDFDTLIRRCDVVSFHVPLTEQTRHLFNKNTLKICKDGLVVINTSRGPVVNADAVLDGVLTNKLGGAGLDVYENEKSYFFEDLSGQVIADSTLARLVNLPNVIITSHQAFLTHEALTAIAETTRNNAKEFFDSGKSMQELTNYVGAQGALKWRKQNDGTKKRQLIKSKL